MGPKSNNTFADSDVVWILIIHPVYKPNKLSALGLREEPHWILECTASGISLWTLRVLQVFEKGMKMYSALLVRLSNGVEIPSIGLGTFRSRGMDVQNAVKWAWMAGIHHIDTASIYKVCKIAWHAASFVIVGGNNRQ